eukprot:2363808-Rhodomonas_salina.1
MQHKRRTPRTSSTSSPATFSGGRARPTVELVGRGTRSSSSGDPGTTNSSDATPCGGSATRTRT